MLLAEHPYNNSATNAHNMTPFFANYSFHIQPKWMTAREAHKTEATMYAHLMQDIDQQAKQPLENTRESMKKYYDRKATEQPNIAVGNLVMLNAKNIYTKPPSKKLSPKVYGPFKVLEKKAIRAYKLEISPRWEIHPLFRVSLLELYPSSNRANREQLLRNSKDSEGNLQ